MYKNAGTILFPNVFLDNSMIQLGRNDCNFSAFCKFGKSEIAKINLFHFGTKTTKIFKIKRRNDILSRNFACHILGGLS